jgi:hypothetical protein
MVTSDAQHPAKVALIANFEMHLDLGKLLHSDGSVMHALRPQCEGQNSR